MVRMCRKYNITLIIVTHDLEIARYADRIVHIIDGEITSVEENVSVYSPEDEGQTKSDINENKQGDKN